MMIHNKNIRLDEEKKKSGNDQCFPALIIFVISLKYSSLEIFSSYHFMLSWFICIKILSFVSWKKKILLLAKKKIKGSMHLLLLGHLIIFVCVMIMGNNMWLIVLNLILLLNMIVLVKIIVDKSNCLANIDMSLSIVFLWNTMAI